MRWDVEERLRRVLPYGFWKWRDDNGAVVETIFNRRSKPLATRIGGIATEEVIEPPRRGGDLNPDLWIDPIEYFYGAGINGPRNGFPWRGINGWTAAAVRRHCEAIAREWGLDPEALYRKAAVEIRAENAEKRRRFGRGRFG
jgi:hypothetical protein